MLAEPALVRGMPCTYFDAITACRVDIAAFFVAGTPGTPARVYRRSSTRRTSAQLPLQVEHVANNDSVVVSQIRVASLDVNSESAEQCLALENLEARGFSFHCDPALCVVLVGLCSTGGVM